MDHYEQLGVKPDATADEIKSAYRAKASQTHPDKGGSAEEFTPIATAYEVLSDPNRRLLYDSTGQDRQTPIEKEVQQILLSLFNEALQQPHDIELVAYVRKQITGAGKQFGEQRKNLKDRQKKLKAKRGKIKSTAAVNLVHMVIDGELRSIEAGLQQIDHKEQVQKAMMAELETYSEKWDAPKQLVTQETLIEMLRNQEPIRFSRY
jgi:curved DNA-binding protein CbpA